MVNANEQGRLTELWRGLSGALERLEDYGAFCTSLTKALTACEPALGLTLAPTPEESHETTFKDGALIFPVNLRGMSRGHVEWSVEDHPPGSAEIELLGSLTEFIALLLSRANQAGLDADRRALLRLLLDQAPVAIVAFRESGEVVVANSLAERWLETLEVDLARVGPVVCGACDGRLVFGEVRGIMPERGLRALVLTDVSANQGHFLQGLETRFYRSKLEQTPLTVALLRHSEGGWLLQRQGDLRRAMTQDVVVGAYDAHSIGVLVEQDRPTARRMLRQALQQLHWPMAMEVGLATTRDPVITPDALLESVTRTEKQAEALLPKILVVEPNRAVSEAIRAALRGRAEIQWCADCEGAQRLLESQLVDASIVEVDAVPALEGQLLPDQTLVLRKSKVTGGSGAFPAMAKPFVVSELQRWLAGAV